MIDLNDLAFNDGKPAEESLLTSHSPYLGDITCEKILYSVNNECRQNKILGSYLHLGKVTHQNGVLYDKLKEDP